MSKSYIAEEIIKIIYDYGTGLLTTKGGKEYGEFRQYLPELVELFNPTPVFKRGDKIEYRANSWSKDEELWVNGEYFDYCKESDAPYVVKMKHPNGKIYITATTAIRKPLN